MRKTEKYGENIYGICTPYKDIFTTVYFVKTDRGALLFDTASFDCDIDEYILPALEELGIGNKELKYVFISHNHKDHAGGLERLLEYFPDVTVISKSPELKEKHPEGNVVAPEENERFLDCLTVVSIMGHTSDSAALYDERTKTLISGDCLQLYGIFGSGKWGANISFPKEYASAIKALSEMDIDALLTAHDYHPYGRCHFGKEAVGMALSACTEPFALIKDLILAETEADDERIAEMYNSETKLPTLSAHVVREYRKSFDNG